MAARLGGLSWQRRPDSSRPQVHRQRIFRKISAEEIWFASRPAVENESFS
jgi:hypothetical protein